MSDPTRAAHLRELAQREIARGNGWWTATNLAFAIGPMETCEFIAACDPTFILSLLDATSEGAHEDTRRVDALAAFLDRQGSAELTVWGNELLSLSPVEDDAPEMFESLRDLLDNIPALAPHVPDGGK